MKTGLFNARHRGPGPGGWDCPCCGPSPKERKGAARQHKKRTYKLLDRLERDPQTMQEWREANPEPTHGCGHMQGRGAA